MKQFLNSVILIFLTIMIVAPLSLSFFRYKVQLKKIKREVKWRLIYDTPKDELVYFEFDMKSEEFLNLKWYHSREFEMNHEMFDIVEGDTIGDYVKYLCFPDEEETILNAQFRGKLKDRYAKDVPIKNRTTIMASLMMGLYYSSKKELIELPISFKKLKNIYIPSMYKSIELNIEDPPPKLT